MNKRFTLVALSLLLILALVPGNTFATTAEEECIEANSSFPSCGNWVEYNYYYQCRGNDTYIVYQDRMECRHADGRIETRYRERPELFMVGICPYSSPDM